MRRARVTRGALVTLAALAGCHSLTVHRPQNAPGIVRVDEPPKDLASRSVESPDDPGEHLLVASAGVTVAGSLRVGAPGDDGASWHGLGGLEASVHRGDNDFSHHGDAFFVYPARAWGLNLDWQVLDNDFGVGPLALEVQRTILPWGLSAGPAWDPDDGSFGAQATASMAGYYVRASYLHDRGVDFEIGLAVKLPTVWVWSR